MERDRQKGTTKDWEVFERQFFSSIRVNVKELPGVWF